LPEDDTVQYPFLFQYKVRPDQSKEGSDNIAAAIATVVVFAASGTVGRRRSLQFIARNQWHIITFMRAMIICPQHLGNFDAALKKVYRQAELFGIAACFDGLKKHPHI
jgi:hypothetical protein